MKNILLTTLSIILLNSYCQKLIGQQNQLLQNKKQYAYKIDGKIIGLQDTTVMLAYYFGGKQYATDTADVKNEMFSFKGNKELDGGMYMIVLPNQQYFDVVISEQFFSFTTNLNSLIENMKFNNSKENTPFYDYLKFITYQQKLVTPLREKQQTASDNEKVQLSNSILEIDKRVKDYKEKFESEYSNIFFTKVIQATTDPIIPIAPDTLNKQEAQIFQFEYYKDHYWDNMDFTDSRMLKTPVFFSRMDTYLNKLTIQQPDSIKKSADILVNLSRKNYAIFQYVVSYITSTYERSKIMGMDAVFVHMVENYYMTKEAKWVDEKQLIKIEERAEKIAPNLIGRPSPPFLNQLGYPFMKNEKDEVKRLYDIESKYTVLIFYAPDCGHCKKELPKVKKIIDSITASPKFLSPHKSLDVKVYAVQTEFDKEAWIKFIQEHNTGNWTNVSDIQTDPEGNPAASSNWRDEYDIYSTPVIYLLDIDKKILAKRIDYKQISKVIKRLEEIESNSKKQ